MASTVQKAFRLPKDVVEVLDAQNSATEYVVEAIREKVRKDKIERFRASARRIASLSREDQDVEFALEAQSEVVLGS